ncbi:carboxy terminal-processing peptidase [Microbulbifer thermotolerans]|uniref:Carboxy terminal-processing peptidase n=1 Tax=Microbulbifer thermotolerans TaxID=252514 RepID=A0A143HLH4_MICTH|nr:carboxy terminal-processing peptidase [Microbulbifer thermotolerans]AMX02575.1 peptidase S41 [Microbulbifer thermotolerans]MCX2779717.1 carboxy terminal-processing peptidase [Microbulbifer thermotolerans]MCX2782351.1 carboxy terminal-processing peptidase [Microbulbifer thermotolerans]MCX2794940.1 carboxy terminal-processing peptidase [Microbulbifer thermotolerans]MCX2800504.1 carboxy terminal-processing peptidase [Microbulbifer thermotolerans]
MQTNRIAALFSGFLFLTLTLFSAATLAELDSLQPEEDQGSTAREIVGKLEMLHYNKLKLSDDMSEKLWEEYIEALDPTKSYFLASDISEFRQWRTKLDDQLRAGQVKAGFDIYNRFRLRLTDRLNNILNQLDKGLPAFDFTRDEYLELDREDSDWPASISAADELWRKRLKSSVLNLRLTGKKDEEIRDLLVRRYKGQLKRIHQQSSDDVFELYMNSLTRLYDPHSNYLSPRSLENFNMSMSLSLEGIGAVLQMEDEYTKVARLVAGGPADRSGKLKPNDKIVAVGQGKEGEMVDVVGWRLDDVVDLIRGEAGSYVRLETIPTGGDGTHRTILIKRSKVKLEDQAAKKATFEFSDGEKTYKIGVINLPTFYIDFEAYRRRDPNYKSTTRDVAKLLEELKAEKVDGIILDLRNNGGGSLQEATMLTDLFIDQGPVVQIRHANEQISRHNRSRSRAMYRGPLMVLINRLSASASEIFAGAIQDYNRGLVVGNQSFGKGTVQTMAPLKEGQLKITQSKFYRVSGDSTQHAGVTPDIQMPRLIDVETVGESAYDTALPWDRIHAVPHAKYFNLKELLPSLISKHQQRTAADPDFIFLREQFQFETERADQEYVSLNEKTREMERKELNERLLTMENRRRTAKGLEPYKTFEEYEESESEEVANIGGPVEIKLEKDPILNEAGYIMADFISLYDKIAKSPPQVANF